jgi:hypothetical protein
MDATRKGLLLSFSLSHARAHRTCFIKPTSSASRHGSLAVAAIDPSDSRHSSIWMYMWSPFVLVCCGLLLVLMWFWFRLVWLLLVVVGWRV